MKVLLMLLTLSMLTLSCEEDTTQTEKAKMGAPAQSSEVQPDQAQGETNGIAEENDMCICTKDYRPVCGKNGVTYPNPCQAGCDDVKEFEEGPCPPDSGLKK